jgi:hypothetical protein
MTVLKIPKKMAQEDLVLIPRKEYEELLSAHVAHVPEIAMTTSEKRALLHARKELKAGKTISFNEFSRKLGSRGRH